ncbi:hypothetical protein [Leptospira ellinghausenii]|nr:hypothetical protein [Leptospira ellinghausenii]
MLYINTQNPHRNFLNFLKKVFQNKEIPKYLDPTLLGQLNVNKLSISPQKILSINPNINKREIESDFQGIPLSFHIKNEKTKKSYNLDESFLSNEFDEILIEDSDLNIVELGYRINRRINIKIKIANSEINQLQINYYFQAEGGIGSIFSTFQNTKINILIIENSTQSPINIENINIELLYTKTENLKLSNCNFKYPIFQNLNKFKLTLKNSVLILPQNLPLFSDFENKIKSNFKQDYFDIKETEIISSLKYLKTLNESAPFTKTIERFYSYFDSRRGLINKILFAYTNYYYNILIPFLGTLILLITIQTIFQSEHNPCEKQTIANLFSPIEITKNCFLSDFKLSLKINNISFEKIFLIILSGATYFSIFSLTLAFKRRFGYNKIE